MWERCTRGRGKHRRRALLLQLSFSLKSQHLQLLGQWTSCCRSHHLGLAQASSPREGVTWSSLEHVASPRCCSSDDPLSFVDSFLLAVLGWVSFERSRNQKQIGSWKSLSVERRSRKRAAVPSTTKRGNQQLLDPARCRALGPSLGWRRTARAFDCMPLQSRKVVSSLVQLLALHEWISSQTRGSPETRPACNFNARARNLTIVLGVGLQL